MNADVLIIGAGPGGIFSAYQIIKNNTNLVYFTCIGNNLRELDLSKNPQLNHLDCSKNSLTELKAKLKYSIIINAVSLLAILTTVILMLKG